MTEDPTLYQVGPLKQLLALMDEGRIDPPPYQVMPLDQVAEAQRQVATGHVRGKILLDLTQ